ncbi:MAG: metal ABC transporter permease [Clostridia bacterium]|jgi:zinc transport system permease protein|nr:metal ABC transporter permease [Clostridia bacterium]
MPEILQYTFMQKAFVVGLLVGGLCPSIGTFLVLRRLSMVGETLAHTSLAGVLLGILWGISPLPFALLVSILIVFVLEKLRKIFPNYAELSLAIIMSAGLGLAVVLMEFTNASDTSVTGLLFGSIITLSNQDILLIGLLSFLSILVIIRYYREFFYLTFDEEGARLAGIAVERFNYFLLFLTTMVIAIGLRIVGALLISSLMIVPVAASLLLSRGFKQTLLFAVLIGILSVLIGLVTSFYLGLAPGGAIVLSSVIIFLIILLFKKIHP